MDRFKIYIDTMGRTCIKIEYLIYTNMYEMDRFKGNLRENYSVYRQNVGFLKLSLHPLASNHVLNFPINI